MKRGKWNIIGVLLSVLVAALCLQPPSGVAKLDVPYGKDGAPPDAETQAKVDALNKALDGPKEGQSLESWQAEFQAAHDALYGTASEDSEDTGCSTRSAPPSSGGATSSTTASEDLGDGADLCQSPIDFWIPSDSTETVAEAIGEPCVRAELIQHLETYLRDQLYLALWSTPVQFSQLTITRLACPQCAMTYLECLTQGLGVDFCKRHYLNCPTDPSSALSIDVSLIAPAMGTVTFEASAGYRKINDPKDPLPYEWCVTIHAYETAGLGPLDPVAHHYINDMLAQGAFCAHAWHWDY